jgi:hypothetical protein
MYSLQWIKIQRDKCTAYNELKYRGKKNLESIFFFIYEQLNKDTKKH